MAWHDLSKELRQRLFPRTREETPALTVSLTWCWVVPVLAVMLWIDLGQIGGRRSSGMGTEHSSSQHAFVVSNQVAAAMATSDHSLLNHLPERTFASTKMTVSPSTNPPPTRVTHSFEIR